MKNCDFKAVCSLFINNLSPIEPLKKMCSIEYVLSSDFFCHLVYHLYYAKYAMGKEADVRGGEAPALMESLTLLPEYRPKRPPSLVFEQVALLKVEESGEYCRVFCDQGGAGVYRLLAAAEGFLVPIGSSGAVFAIIDIAARPEI